MQPARRHRRRRRDDLGQDHAHLDAQGRSPSRRCPAGGHLGGGALKDPDGFAVESGIPGNVTLAVNGDTFTLNGKGPWLVTADSEGPHVVPGKMPPRAADRAAVTASRPSAALLVTGQELLLGLVADANTRFLAHELDALGIELRRVSIVGDGARRDRRGRCASWPVTTS